MKKLSKMSLFLLVLLVFAIPIYVLANQNSVFTVQVKDSEGVSITEAHPGDTIVLDVGLKGATEYAAIGIEVPVDTSAFEIVKVEEPNKSTYVDYYTTFGAHAAAASNDNTKGMFTASFAKANAINTNYNGGFGKMTLKVKDDAAGDYEFKATVTEFKKKLSEDAGNDEDITTYTTEVGKIKILVPATGINVKEENVDLFWGDTYQIDVTPTPANTTTAKDESYSILSGESVTVSTTGKVEAVKNGVTKVKVRAYGYDKTITFNVTNPIKELKLDQSDVELEILDKQNNGGGITYGSINVTPNIVLQNPDGDSSDDETITWESKENSIAKVEDGKITAVSGGTTQIIAKTTTGISASVNVTVKVPITSASISETADITLNRGATKDLSVTYYPQNTTENTTIKWESTKPQVATVNNGKVTAVSGGDTVIKASIGEYNFEVNVHVFVDIDSLDILDEDFSLVAPQTKKLNLQINPSDTSEKSKITWESNHGDIVSVDPDGTVHALQPGDATITVRYKDKSDSVNIKVLIPIDSITILPNSDITMNKGETKNLSVDIQPATAEEDKTVTWESDNPNVATIDKTSGLLKAVGGGSATITARLKNGKTATATVTVKVPVTEVILEDGKESINVNKNTTKTIKIKINPSDYTDTTPTHWESSSEEVATVNQNGEITALSNGQTIITATKDGKSDTIIVYVITPIESVVINEKSGLTDNTMQLEKNHETNLTATVNPSDTNEEYTLKWSSSDDDIASVSATGVVTAKKAGTVTITATANNKSDSIKVNVFVPISSFTPTKEDIEIIKGKTFKVSYQINPSDATESKVIAWSSSENSVATVNSEGVITALKEGTTVITGTLKNGMSININVTVKIIPLNDIEISAPEEMLKGETYDMEITPDPIDTTELNNVLYSSSDESILTVDENGKVTALKEGEAKIKVTVGEIEKEITIKVNEIHVEKIQINSLDELTVGNGGKLGVSAYPANNTDNLTYTYESSDESILTIDKDGNFKALASGTVTITVTASNGQKQTLTVKVMAKPVEDEHTSDENVTNNEDLVSPQTGATSNIVNLILSIISLGLIGVFGYAKHKIIKNN